MRLRDIPPCHLAKSKYSKNLIVLTGTKHAIHLDSGFGNSYDIDSFNDDYEDLGELRVTLEEVVQYKVKVSVV